MRKFRFVSVFVICVSLFLASCSKGERASGTPSALKDFAHTEYIVSYTSLKPGGYVATYDKDGKLLDTSKIEARNILSNTKSEDKYYFSSNRNDKHYEISQNGEIQMIAKPKELENVRDGAYFIHSEQGYVYYDMNVGMAENDSYVSQLVFGKEGEPKQHVKLHGTIQGAHILNETLYAFSQTAEKLYISTIDLTTKKKVKEIEIPNRDVFFSSSSRKSMFEVANGKLVLALSDNVDQKLPSYLAVINPDRLQVEKEVTLPNPQFIPMHMQVVQNELYVISEEGEVLAFDASFRLAEQFKLQGMNQAQKEGGIADIQIEDDKAYLFYQYTSKSSQKGNERGVIYEYSLADGKKVHEVTIKFDRDAEDITFLVKKKI
ncbi:hypothetical protein ACFDTO_32745 [Microbacteriaceae bacterium 4G12]